MSDNPIIRIENLGKIFPGPDGEFYALEDINLDIRRGKYLGLSE